MSAASLLVATWLASVPVLSVVEDPPLEVTVPHMESAEAQLAYARRLKGELRKRKPQERDFWRGLTVEAYEAVPHFFPDASAFGSEACFRAGELLRVAGEVERARAVFRRARRLGRGTPFRARAGLELGHLARRAGELRAAREAYLDVASDASASRAHRDDAWIWAGRVWATEGRIEDARSAWRRVADGDGDALDRIFAFDELALSRVAEDDLEAAAGVLNQCVQALSEVALEETRRGESVRNALVRMRVIRALRRQISSDRSSRRAHDHPRRS